MIDPDVELIGPHRVDDSVAVGTGSSDKRQGVRDWKLRVRENPLGNGAPAAHRNDSIRKGRSGRGIDR